MRRIVTGHRDGKSVILDDAESGSVGMPIFEFFGGKILNLWEIIGTPNIPLPEIDLKKPLPAKALEPGMIRFQIYAACPYEEAVKFLQKQGINEQTAAANWRKTWNDQLGMHTTNTVETNIVISGELSMELDDGVEVQLKPGDCVVQNGTRHHRWNRGTEDCVMACFIVGTKRST